MFVAKLQNWLRKVNTGNTAKFERLSELQDSNGELDPLLKNYIFEQLELLEIALLMYFLDLDDSEEKIVRNPSPGNICVENLPETSKMNF